MWLSTLRPKCLARFGPIWLSTLRTKVLGTLCPNGLGMLKLYPKVLGSHGPNGLGMLCSIGLSILGTNVLGILRIYYYIIPYSTREELVIYRVRAYYTITILLLSKYMQAVINMKVVLAWRKGERPGFWPGNSGSSAHPSWCEENNRSNGALLYSAYTLLISLSLLSFKVSVACGHLDALVWWRCVITHFLQNIYEQPAYCNTAPQDLLAGSWLQGFTSRYKTERSILESNSFCRHPHWNIYFLLTVMHSPNTPCLYVSKCYIQWLSNNFAISALLW